MNPLMIIKWEQLLLHHEDCMFHYLAKKIRAETWCIFSFNDDKTPLQRKMRPNTKEAMCKNAENQTPWEQAQVVWISVLRPMILMLIFHDVQHYLQMLAHKHEKELKLRTTMSSGIKKRRKTQSRSEGNMTSALSIRYVFWLCSGYSCLFVI